MTLRQWRSRLGWKCCFATACRRLPPLQYSCTHPATITHIPVPAVAAHSMHVASACMGRPEWGLRVATVHHSARLGRRCMGRTTAGSSIGCHHAAAAAVARGCHHGAGKAQR